MRVLFFIASLFVFSNSVFASGILHYVDGTQIQDTVYKDYKQYFQVAFFNEWRTFARQNTLEAITMQFTIGENSGITIQGFSANTKIVYRDFIIQVIDRLNALELRRKPFINQLQHADSSKNHVFLITFILDLFDGSVQNRRNELQEGIQALITSTNENMRRSLSGSYDAEPLHAIVLDPVVIKSPFTFR